MMLSLYLLRTYNYSLISVSLCTYKYITMYFVESDLKFDLAVQSICLTRSLAYTIESQIQVIV